MAKEVSMKQEANIEQLDKNPMFQLSLASRELFHSNFLYWLSLHEKNEFRNLVEELSGDEIQWPENLDNWKVLREYKNLDLCIIEYDPEENNEKKALKKFLFVLENKVKGIATKRQLEEYYDMVDKENNGHKCSFCLLTLYEDFLECEEINKEKKWTIRSYSDLAKALKMYYLKDDASSGKSYIIEQYRQFILSLDEIAKSKIPNWKSRTWEDTAVHKKISRLRIDNFIKKIIGNKIAIEIAGKLSEQRCKVKLNVPDSDIWKNPKEGQTEDCHDCILLTAGYGNKGILIHLSKFISKDVLVRLEIEGNIYKRGIITRKESPQKKSRNKGDVPNYPIFVKDIRSGKEPAIKYPKALKEEWALKKKNIGTYNMKQLMKYQSVIIPGNSTLSEIMDAVVEDFNQICDELIKQPSNSNAL